MYDRIKDLIARWHAVREVDNLTDRDLDDLAMTRHQVSRFARMPRDVPDRVAAMAEIFGLEAGVVKADHARYLELLDTCGTCGHRDACKLVLENGDLARAHDAGFCPNAAAFRDLAQA